MNYLFLILSFASIINISKASSDYLEGDAVLCGKIESANYDQNSSDVLYIVFEKNSAVFIVESFGLNDENAFISMSPADPKIYFSIDLSQYSVNSLEQKKISQLFNDSNIDTDQSSKQFSCFSNSSGFKFSHGSDIQSAFKNLKGEE